MKTDISVALAAYNGENYIEKQIFSIINQSYPVKEIIIVDDNSNDNTYNLLKKLQLQFQIIYIIRNPINLGPVESFKLAIENCKSNFVLLSDQDDIWYYNKVEICINRISYFSNTNKPLIVCSDLELIDVFDNKLNNSFWQLHNFSVNNFTLKKSLSFNQITGCTIMMNKYMKEEIKNMPVNILMHDHWIYLIALCFGHVDYIDIPLVKYRSHINTVTSKNKLVKKERLSRILNYSMRNKYLLENIEQATLFYKIYKDKLSSVNKKEILNFIKIKNKTFLYKKLYVFFNKYY